jgi:predicted transcriptional regulator
MRKAFLALADFISPLVPSLPMRNTKVQDVMTYHDIKLAHPEDSLLDAARIMKQKDIGFLPVVFGDKLVGTLTDRDIVIRGLVNINNVSSLRVRDAMSSKYFVSTMKA